MRTFLSILCLFFISILSTFGQGQSYYTPGFNDEDGSVYESQFQKHNIQDVLKRGDWDHLSINADERIADLLDIQKELSISIGGIDGYRVQLFQGSKDEADQIKARFLSLYPEFPADRVYRKFPSPDFRVRVGDFRTRSEAIKLKYTVEKSFPNPLIVEDIINFPDLVFKEGEK